MKKNLSKLFSHNQDLDTRSTQFLMKALENNDLPGFDYIEFKQAMAALLNMNMDENTAFKSAFATASTMGLTKQKLMETAKHYKQILHKEKGQFDVALKNRREQKVIGKAEENKQLEARIQQIQSQIQRLQQELEEVKQKIQHNNENKSKEEKVLAAHQENFEATYTSIQAEIDSDIEKINQIL